MSEHTPGPWEADIRAYGYEVRPKGEQRECWATIGGKQPLACHEPVLDPNPDTPTPYVPLTNEQIATARLIAAAPDLLAALEDNQWGGTAIIYGSEWPSCPCCGRIEPLSSASVKASGDAALWARIWDTASRSMGHTPECEYAAALKAARGE